MTFLAPWMLIGAAAVSIPIALHFFYRARYKPLPWAPMKFLKEAIEQTSRRLKFQEWILLALRCLAIILLAFAIARPGFNTASVAGRGDAIDAVFVIDTSYSMTAGDGNVPRIERAKEAALEVLKTLPANSSVQIFTCSDRANFIGPAQPHNLDQARNLIPKIEVTGLASDLLPGLSEALTATKNGSAPAKEIYVFTDMQKDAFERQQGAIKAKCEEIKPAASLIFIRCGKADATTPNIAVQNVRWISPDVPHTRTRLPFVIDLKNTSTETVKGLHVYLEIDSKSVEKDAVVIDQIEKDQSYPVTLTGSLEQPGVSVIGVKIEKDQLPFDKELPGDNVLYKSILVRDKVRVLLVDGTPNPNLPTDAGDHFVKTALNPGRASDYYIESESVAASEAGPKDLEGKDVVFLLNAPIRDKDPTAGLSQDFLKRLNEFVRQGGGLVIGSGDQIVPDAYNKALGSGGTGLLPFDIKKDPRTTSETAPYRPAADSVDQSSFLAPFAKYADALQIVAIFRMLDLEDSGAGGRVLATADGRPYVASKVVGSGEVVMITGSLDERWGNFSSDPGLFQVPFSRYLLTHLTSRKAATGAIVAGNPIQWLASHNADGRFDEYELVKPPRAGEKTRERVKLELGEPNAEGKRPVTTHDTTRPGLYHIVPVGKADTSGPVFTVNSDLRESANLALASDEDVGTWLGFKPAIIAAGAGTEGAVEQLRTRSEWTEFVLLFLLLLLLAEAAWAWVCGRAW
jgi:hypothetical protein